MSPTATIEKAKAVLQIEAEQLTRLADNLNESFVEAIDALKQAIDSNHKIIVIGVGKSENIATKIVATFNSTGATSVSLSCQNALHGDLGLISDGDVVIALSQSGETREMLDLLPHLRKTVDIVITVTGQTNSTLAGKSDIVIDTHVEKEACPHNLAPTSSSTNMLAIGDALAMVLIEARGFQAEDFVTLHPGGSLGNRLTKVSEVMRTGEEFATVRPDDSVESALVAMQKAKAGAATVLNADGTLAGIFTHGDFVRCFQADRTAADQMVKIFMSTEPVTVQSDDLTSSLREILKEHKIDDVIVLDENSRAIGLVDTQDLTRNRLI